MTESAKLADELYQAEQAIKLMDLKIKDLKQQLVSSMTQEQIPEVLGAYGQRYKISKSRASYKFNLPLDEYSRLGIATICTPNVDPRMTKTLCDQLLKEGVIKHSVVSEWEKNGWYSKEGGDEYTITQTKSGIEDITF